MSIRRPLFYRMTSVVLALAVPFALMAADTGGAMLFPTGSVSVNGSPTPRSQALLPGDRVQTGVNSAVSITAAGTTVQIGPQSAMLFDGKAVEVTDGNVVVNTSSGMKGRLLNFEVQPAGDSAKYNFGRRNGKIVLAALEGRLRISDGRQEMVLEPGKAFMMNAAAPEPQQKGGGGGGGLSTGAIVGISVAVAALGAVVAFVAADQLRPSTSPVQ